MILLIFNGLINLIDSLAGYSPNSKKRQGRVYGQGYVQRRGVRGKRRERKGKQKGMKKDRGGTHTKKEVGGVSAILC